MVVARRLRFVVGMMTASPLRLFRELPVLLTLIAGLGVGGCGSITAIEVGDGGSGGQLEPAALQPELAARPAAGAARALTLATTVARMRPTFAVTPTPPTGRLACAKVSMRRCAKRARTAPFRPATRAVARRSSPAATAPASTRHPAASECRAPRARDCRKRRVGCGPSVAPTIVRAAAWAKPSRAPSCAARHRPIRRPCVPPFLARPRFPALK